MLPRPRANLTKEQTTHGLLAVANRPGHTSRSYRCAALPPTSTSPTGGAWHTCNLCPLVRALNSAYTCTDWSACNTTSSHTTLTRRQLCVVQPHTVLGQHSSLSITNTGKHQQLLAGAQQQRPHTNPCRAACRMSPVADAQTTRRPRHVAPDVSQQHSLAAPARAARAACYMAPLPVYAAAA